MGFVEIADRVFVSRQRELDLNVVAVGGASGLVVVDTQSSSSAALRVIEELRAAGLGPVTAVVNTHDHFDHSFGNHAFRQEYGALPVHAHEEAATALAATRPTHETPIVVPDHTFSSVAVLDLGDRQLELVHPGRGHTAGDLVVRIAGAAPADVLLAGDLVEESGPPAYGPDSHPLDWPLSLDLVLGLLGPSTVVVPGHGALVDRDYVHEQRSAIGQVAETIRHLATEGIPESEALAAHDWPYPREALQDAVRRGYAALPRAQRRLPLV